MVKYRTLKKTKKHLDGLHRVKQNYNFIDKRTIGIKLTVWSRDAPTSHVNPGKMAAAGGEPSSHVPSDDLFQTFISEVR